VNLFVQLPFVAGVASLLLAGVSVVRRKPSFATWCFFAGMIALGNDSIFTGMILRGGDLGELMQWMTDSFMVGCFIPVIWLGFSLAYSRSGYAEYLRRWKVALAVVGLLPIALSVLYRHELFRLVAADAERNAWRLQLGPAANVRNVIMLVALVLTLVNLEQTFRSAVGTMRWRIKYVVLAIVMILGARLYVSTQTILFSSPDVALWGIKSGGLLIGCVFLTLAYTRTGWHEIDVHPSSAVLRSSLTVIIVGVYLFVIGAVSVLVKRFGGAEVFQLQAFVVLLGMAGLAVLVLSDRARQRLHVFVARHFTKAQHDSVQVWTSFARGLARITDQSGLCSVSAKLIAETFDVLTITIWLLDEETGEFRLEDSTGRTGDQANPMRSGSSLSGALASGLHARSSPFDLENIQDAWADELRQLNPSMFPSGGNRLCLPLVAGPRVVGVVVLADRINGTPYSVEELELLRCIADHITSVLLNIRFAGELARGRELEAFRTMSAFFVHDLKNAAASLNLMLKNLPLHFDDPEFRQDALRAIGNTAQRIDDIIARLSELRQRPEAIRVDTDLNEVVTTTLAGVDAAPDVELVSELAPLPAIIGDRDQLQSVLTNLIMNARDAVGPGGRIRVRTERRGDRVVLSVIDNGCGMSPSFINDSLFRPFQSTKKKGLGIGLFQSRAIVLAHGGAVQVESVLGQGTSFHASIPINPNR
jgi:putative PEP-CTERM system histidine kinase